MAHHSSRNILWHRAIAVLLAVSALTIEPVLAGDGATEHAQLAALIRQLDMIDRLAEHSASLPRQDGSRYYFDYERLHKDIERIRQGVRDYLVPERAQPRDPVELLGQYRQTSEAYQ
ncbi:RAQPRD family integrative conjugative element protein [uncultured Porticoccus sp.]|mgnify:CR=1 FL=1|uniref:integrative conjugative element protein, RAQPRD family n=1 Tax=uncultured Porticoccus sp. TaxID=1256050 RepID=UPI00260C503F|nr:RAQPRD family integrative conjugative element protein [uncultured Porticoccus sp.]|tara:strand:+ start:82102 stop:82452 length:351 start_codon:yes stop_codon:yes gene_type:complete